MNVALVCLCRVNTEPADGSAEDSYSDGTKRLVKEAQPILSPEKEGSDSEASPRVSIADR